ncbi:MAG: hypothetical protein WC292_02250 [Clostridia bacterium]
MSKYKKIFYYLIVALGLAVTVTIIMLFLVYGTELAALYDVIGIRIAMLFMAVLSFLSTSLFSFLIYSHNRTARISNEDANKRAELFRNMQFSSANYSIVEFKMSLSIYKESSRYVSKFIEKGSFEYHMLEEGVAESEVLDNPKAFKYITIKIPYGVAEGKLLGRLIINRIRFKRQDKEYFFVTPESESLSHAFLLFNEVTQNNDAIINLVVRKDSDFFKFGAINDFSKIKLNLLAVSVLGVAIEGISELHFTNPEHKEADGSNVYKINSSTFFLTDQPHMVETMHKDLWNS